jgi:polyisoprenyl-phosphate glycosyltransferase
VTQNSKLLSIIVPIFNEEKNIAKLYDEVSSVCKQLKVFADYEIIMIDDGSRDNSLHLLKNLSQKDFRVKIVSFTRNFGHEPATTAGLFHANGDAACIIDADLQDPPSLFLEFEKEYKNGYDIVYGQRTKRLNEAPLKKLSSLLFYPFFKWITKIDMPYNIGDFCLMSRKSINLFKQFPERSRFVRALIYWPGLSKIGVPFVRQQRLAGDTKQGTYHRITTAINFIVSFSMKPIFFIIFFALLLVISSAITFIASIGLHLTNILNISLNTFLLIAGANIFSAVFFCISIIGLYAAKTFIETNQRPIYLVDTLTNFEKTHTRTNQTLNYYENNNSSTNI